MLCLRDFLQTAPERIFQADTGFVSINRDGALDDRGFHRCVPIVRSLVKHRSGDSIFRGAGKYLVKKSYCARRCYNSEYRILPFAAFALKERSTSPMLASPGGQARRAKVAKVGYGVPGDFEMNWGKYLPSFGR